MWLCMHVYMLMSLRLECGYNFGEVGWFNYVDLLEFWLIICKFVCALSE